MPSDNVNLSTAGFIGGEQHAIDGLLSIVVGGAVEDARRPTGPQGYRDGTQPQSTR